MRTRVAAIVGVALASVAMASGMVRAQPLPSVEAYDAPADDAVMRSNVNAISLDSIGISAGAQASALVGGGITRAEAVALLHQLPAQIASEALRRVMVQALAAPWPLTDSDEAVPAGVIIAKRLELLVQLGGEAQAADLALQLLGQSQLPDAVLQAAWPVLWLDKGPNDACPTLEKAVADIEAPTATTVRVLCKLATASEAEAQLAIDLMDEQKLPVPDAVRALVTAKHMKQAVDVTSLDAPMPLWQQVVALPMLSNTAVLDVLPTLPPALQSQLAKDDARPAALAAYAAALHRIATQPNPSGQWVTPARLILPATPTDIELREALRSYAVLKALGEPVDATAAASWPAPTDAIQVRSVSAPALDALAAHATQSSAPAVALKVAKLVGEDVRTLDDQAFARMVAAIEAAGDRALAKEVAADGIASFQQQAALEKTRETAVQAVAKAAAKKAPKAKAKTAAKPAKKASKP